MNDQFCFFIFVVIFGMEVCYPVTPFLLVPHCLIEKSGLVSIVKLECALLISSQRGSIPALGGGGGGLGTGQVVVCSRATWQKYALANKEGFSD